MPEKKLLPYVKYASGYSHSNMPNHSRFTEKITRRFTGVRSCSKQDRADGAAKAALESIIKRELRYNSHWQVIRKGWKEGTHYWDNIGGGFGTTGRECSGFVETEFYFDYIEGEFRTLPRRIRF